MQSTGFQLQQVVVMVTVSGLANSITCTVTLALCRGTLCLLPLTAPSSHLPLVLALKRR